ncbi:MAG: OmpA family protein [Flavobacteriales bacterium]
MLLLMMLNLNTTRRNTLVTKKSINRSFISFNPIPLRALRILPGAFLFLCFSFAATAQTTWTDEFKELSPLWRIGAQKNIKAELNLGELILYNNDEKATRIFRREIPINPSDNFSIETAITFKSGKPTAFFGIIWGFEYWSDYHAVWLRNNNTMQYKISDSKATAATTFDKNVPKELLLNKGMKNVLRIDKKNDSLCVFLNSKKILGVKYTKHEGNDLGFIMDAGVTLAVDYIKVNYTKYDINLIPDAINGFKKENLGPNVNTSCVDLQPVISADGKTLFFSRDECTGNEGSDLSDIFFTSKNDKNEWIKSVHMASPINNAGGNFVVSVTPDLNSMMVGNTYRSDGTPKGQGISLSVKRNGKWLLPVEQVIRDFKHYNRFITYFLTSDGNRLLMSIENHESLGDLDLFISFLQPDKTWSKPVNMGVVLNTYAQEYSPFLAPDGKTLFFSSKGHAGYGSSDIFVTKRLDDTWLNWSVPKNLGTEINTTSLDGYYTLPANGEYAYLVSDQSGNGREDLFRIKVAKSVKPEATAIVIGKVLDEKTKQPINADIYYEDLNNPNNKGTAFSSKEEGFKITLPGGNFYGFTAKAKGYIPSSKNIDLKDLKAFEEKNVDLFVVPMEAGQKARLNNIFFDTDKAALRKESFVELDGLVTSLKENPTIKIEIGGHTDNVGKDASNLDLSLRRAKAVMDYLIGKGISKDRLTFKGYGETTPVATNDTDEGKQLNRRVEITILK